MERTIGDVMTRTPQVLDVSDSVEKAARLMSSEDIGDVIVCRQDTLCGIVTDRDITIRVIAEGRDPATTTLGEVCSNDVTTLSPQDSVADAVRLMREKAIRRIPVVEGGRPVGIVSIGDLAMERDPDSALANVSAAPANH